MTASRLAESDLHGLVDGHIDAGRRADLLRRLAASPADRTLVGSWQDQAETIRSAFREVASEPLPAALDLAPPLLRSVDPLRSPPAGAAQLGGRSGSIAALSTALVVTIGLVASYAFSQTGRDDDAADSRSTRASSLSLAGRTEAALQPNSTSDATPSLQVPDLSASGLRLAGVSTDASDPGTVVLKYRDGGTGRVTLGVTRAAPELGLSPVTAEGRSLTWHSRDAAYALAGTLSPIRMRALAGRLQAGQDPD